MNIGPLNKAFKDGWQPRWIQPTTRSGNGWHTQLQLPLGVTVEMVNGKKNVLAHNLLRKPVEVWPTEPRNQPGVLDLWVADQGSLSGPVPPWPLLAEGEADYFKGVPVGCLPARRAGHRQLMAANYMVGGIMGSGKSSLVIALLLGAMLDPLVDIDVVRDGLQRRLRPDEAPAVGPWSRATRTSSSRPHSTRCATCATRSPSAASCWKNWAATSPRLTREIALKDPRMRPKVVVFDECHELFMHKKYGAGGR